MLLNRCAGTGNGHTDNARVVHQPSAYSFMCPCAQTSTPQIWTLLGRGPAVLRKTGRRGGLWHHLSDPSDAGTSVARFRSAVSHCIDAAFWQALLLWAHVCIDDWYAAVAFSFRSHRPRPRVPACCVHGSEQECRMSQPLTTPTTTATGTAAAASAHGGVHDPYVSRPWLNSYPANAPHDPILPPTVVPTFCARLRSAGPTASPTPTTAAR